MTRPAGYHGKIPAQGDFIQRGLPGGFVRAWDRWLMEGIAELKNRRGEAWLEGYRTAPLWRFSTPAGTFGDQAMIGVLMASVDRVGRNFPLTIAAEAPPGRSGFAALLAEAGALDQMAQAALGALADGATKETLERDVAAIRMDAAPPPDIAETAEALTVTGPSPEGAIAARWLERRYGPETAVFQSDAAHGAERKLIVARGAPGATLVAQLFAGGGAALLTIGDDDDPDFLAPLPADAAAPVAAMMAAPGPAPAGDDDIDALIGGEPLEAPVGTASAPDLPPELDPDIEPDDLEDLAQGASLPASAHRPVTDEELDALIGADPIGDENAPPSPPAGAVDNEEEDDPIAAILAGGGPES